MSNQNTPSDQTLQNNVLWVIDAATQTRVPLEMQVENGGGIPVSFPSWFKTDVDAITADVDAIATDVDTIATQVTTIATNTGTIGTNTGTIATNSTSAVTQGQLRVKGAADITNANTTLFTAASNLTNVSLSLCNTDSSARTVTLTLNASAGTITLFSGLSIAANETVTVGEFGMLSGETIQGSASVTTVVKLGVIGAAN